MPDLYDSKRKIISFTVALKKSRQFSSFFWDGTASTVFFLYIYIFTFLLIHSADPQSRRVGIIVFTHVVRPSVRPSVRTFQNLVKQTKFKVNTMFTTGAAVDLAEWIIECTHVLLHICYALFLVSSEKWGSRKKDWTLSTCIEHDSVRYWDRNDGHRHLQGAPSILVQI